MEEFVSDKIGSGATSSKQDGKKSNNQTGHGNALSMMMKRSGTIRHRDGGVANKETTGGKRRELLREDSLSDEENQD